MQPKVRCGVITLFPEMFPGPLQYSLAGKASDKIWAMDVFNLRDFAKDKHQSVDDSPFGGGAGMVIKPDVADAAIRHVRGVKEYKDADLIYLTPRGKVLDQETVLEFSRKTSLILLCGRYEGLDQRVIEHHAMREISLGDFVLSGGEVAALALLDAVVRLLPGVVGKAEGVVEESFTGGLLEYPHYTRPAEWQGLKVPEVLISGDHGKVAAWRKAQAESVTKERRPDLWAKKGVRG